MAISIKLEYVHNRRESVIIPLEVARAAVAENNQDGIWQMFVKATENPRLHESAFVSQLVNWVEDPQKPPPPIELMQWASILKNAADLSEESTEWILDADEQRLVWNRITDKRFRFFGAPMDYMPFYVKLHEALAKQFSK